MAILAGWLAYSDLRLRDDAGNPGPQAFGRFIVYPAIVVTPAFFGLALWFLSESIVPMLDSNTGFMSRSVANLFFWSAASFAAVVTVALAAQAWVARARMAQFVGVDFGRTEPLIVLPEIAIVFGLALVFLVLGRARAILDGASLPSPVAIDSVILAIQVFMVGSFALLLGVALSNQVEELTGLGFLRALLRGEIGAVVIFVTFIWAFLRLTNL